MSLALIALIKSVTAVHHSHNSMLARKALQVNEPNVWMEEVPEFAQNQLLLDVSS